MEGAVVARYMLAHAGSNLAGDARGFRRDSLVNLTLGAQQSEGIMEGTVPTVGQVVQGAWCACVRFRRSMDSAGLGSVLLAELIKRVWTLQ